MSLGGACSDDDDSEAGIGPEGGVIHVQGLELEIPKGALTQKTVIHAESADDVQPINGRSVVVAFDLSPSGLVFNVPAIARVEYAGSGRDPELFTSSDGRSWSKLQDSRYDSTDRSVSASLMHFSFLSLQVAIGQLGAGGSSGGSEGGAPAGGSDTTSHAGDDSVALPSEGGSAGLGGGSGGMADGSGAAGQTGSSGQGGGWDLSGGAGGQGGGGGRGGEETDGVTCHEIAGSAYDEQEDQCSAGGLSCVPGFVATDFEQQWGDCSDGHSYETYCSDYGPNGACSCDCVIDSATVGTCTYAKQACDKPDFARCGCDMFPELTFVPG